MIDDHKKAVLFFSGGKDSLVLLHLFRPHWHKITVLWLNTGATIPELQRQMDEIREVVPHFLEVRSDVTRSHVEKGYPCTIVRAEDIAVLPDMRYQDPVVKTRSFVDCCKENIWLPSWEAAIKTGATLFLRGTRRADKRASPIGAEATIGPITIWNPLFEWPDSAIWQYLQEHDITIPKYYKYGNSGITCYSCTAFPEHSHEVLAYLKDYAPNQGEELRSNFRKIHTMLKQDFAVIEASANG